MSRDWFEGWPGQYRRMLRWRDRLAALLAHPESVDGDMLYDFAYAFFQSSYHLRDWLIATDASSQAELTRLFASSAELQLCRDICNATKHLQYDRPSLDSRPRIGCEYDPWSKQISGWFLYSDQRRSLGELMATCVDVWNGFLTDKGILEAPAHPEGG